LMVCNGIVGVMILPQCSKLCEHDYYLDMMDCLSHNQSLTEFGSIRQNILINDHCQITVAGS